MSDPERAARYSDLFGGEHEHPPDCAYCPICATIGMIRNVRPEVLDHLAGAAREMLAALTLLMEEAEGVVEAMDGAQRPRTNSAAPADGKVRRIDVG